MGKRCVLTKGSKTIIEEGYKLQLGIIILKVFLLYNSNENILL